MRTPAVEGYPATGRCVRGVGHSHRASLAQIAPFGKTPPRPLPGPHEKGEEPCGPSPDFPALERGYQKPITSVALMARGAPKFTNAELDDGEVSRPPENEPT